MLVLPLIYLGLIAGRGYLWWHHPANTWILSAKPGRLADRGYLGPASPG